MVGEFKVNRVITGQPATPPTWAVPVSRLSALSQAGKN